MIKYHLPLLFLLAVFTGSVIGLFFSYVCPAEPGSSLLDPYVDGVMRGAS
jgi:hypothetical protein